MKWFLYIGVPLIYVLLIILGIAFYVYLRIFYNEKKGSPECLEPLKGKLYKVYPNIFTILYKGEEKSFSYRDLITNDIDIKYI